MRRIKYGGVVAGQREVDAVVDVLKGENWGQGELVAEFERKAATIQQRQHALFVNSGSSALLLAMATLPRGTRVAMPTLQFPTLYSSAVWCGLEPVLVDVDDSFNLDPNQLPENIGAVAFVHLAGNPTNVRQVAAYCAERGMPLIEDNCEGFGGMILIEDGKAAEQRVYKPVGNFGDISCTSTHAAHQISTGEGGLVFCDDREAYLKMKRIRDWGRSYGAAVIPGYYENYTFSELGLNLHNTDIQAALGLIQIERLTEWASARRWNYSCIREGLKDLPITLPRVESDVQPSWYTFPFLCADRDEMREYLEAANIETRTILVGNMVRQPVLGLGDLGKAFPVADDIFKRGLWFSVHPKLTKDHIEYINESVSYFFSEELKASHG